MQSRAQIDAQKKQVNSGPFMSNKPDSTSPQSLGNKEPVEEQNQFGVEAKSQNELYMINQENSANLYAQEAAPDLVPKASFGLSNSLLINSKFTRKWKSSENLRQEHGNRYANDCGMYAQLLRDRVTNAEKLREKQRAQSEDPRVGRTYYISPATNKPTTTIGNLSKKTENPSDITKEIKKKGTNFHVATVVASDGRTIITSEVNAAFAGKKDPWFAMYEGGQGFYNAFKLEYTQLFSSGNNLIRVEPHVEYDDIDQD